MGKKRRGRKGRGRKGRGRGGTEKKKQSRIPVIAFSWTVFTIPTLGCFGNLMPKGKSLKFSVTFCKMSLISI